MLDFYNFCTFSLQGLRTLELCVDNLQPEFLYEHIQPVRAELMQVKHNSFFLLKVLKWYYAC